ncbi:MAG: hypothetical protein WCK46_01240 [Candidatus Adlerbacteria bacterium]
MEDSEKQRLAAAILEAFMSAGATIEELEVLAKQKRLVTHEPDLYVFSGLLPKEPVAYPLHKNVLGVIRGEMVVGELKQWEELRDECKQLANLNEHLRKQGLLRLTVDEVFAWEEKDREWCPPGHMTRIRSLLTKAEISKIGTLVVKTEDELQKLGLGQKTRNTIKESLAGMGLHLGMKLED